MKNNWLITIILVVVVGVAAFFAGSQYQKMQRPSFGGRGFGGNGLYRRFGGANSANTQAVRGQIISSGNGTITVKMQDGSTKLVIVGSSTSIMKAVAGNQSDLITGQNVMIFGTGNSDGSVMANIVQLNPMRAEATPSAK